MKLLPLHFPMDKQAANKGEKEFVYCNIPRAHFQNASVTRLSCEGPAAHLQLCLTVRPPLEVEAAEAGRAGRGSAIGCVPPPQTLGEPHE